ncbi:MAG: LapA family protein [Streptococcus sp.]|nr:LapA family protein [Streptococcus sp.]
MQPTLKKRIIYILLLIVILLITVIALVNMQSVTVNLLIVEIKLPLIILIVLSLLLGSFISFLISIPKNFSIRKELGQAKKELNEQQKKDS